MSKRDNEMQLMTAKLANIGVSLSASEIKQLRLISRQLHNWSEAQCGLSYADGNWCVERDEVSGLTYKVISPHKGNRTRLPIADGEKKAINRLKKITEQQQPLHFYYQPDPRGCALYISNQPLNEMNYDSDGIAIYA